MIQLKYFKNIHGRIINSKTNVIQLNDACIYADKDNNRYCFVTLKNKISSPLFSVLFHIKQYDQTGQFLKEGKFYIPNCYHPTGDFEIDEPFPVEKECDAIEIFVQRAVFATRAFYNDSFTSVAKLPAPFEPKQPSVIPESTTFPHQTLDNSYQNVAKPAATPKVEAKQEEKKDDNAADEPAPVEVVANNQNIEASTLSTDTYGTHTKKNKLMIYAIAFGCVLFLLILWLIIFYAGMANAYESEGLYFLRF